ncbi:MAG: glycosyltransferase family 87 protein [Candidatus Binatia bacterium]
MRPTTWLVRIAAFVVVTVLLVGAAHRHIDPDKVCPDFIQFWTAASLLSEGRDPYDPASQARVQGALGWDKTADGYGIYEFLPYYYPPWLGLAFLPLLPLGYPLAKLVWLVLGGEMLLMSGFLLKDTVRGIPAALAIAVVAIFAFSIKAVAMGQVAPLVLLLIALAWKLLEQRRDVAAGCVLALLTIKPQLTLLLLAAVLAWTARHGRWPVWQGFAATVALLCAASTVVSPSWLPSMLEATRVTPLPTVHYPGLGATWYVALEAVGLRGLLLYAAYSAMAVPLLLALFRMSLAGRRSLEDIVAVALIVPFFVAPYARPYDFPVLLIPALVLMGSRLSEMSRAMLVFALTVLPALHILRLAADYVPPVVGVRRPEFTYFWIPLLIAATWLKSSTNGSREKVPGSSTS